MNQPARQASVLEPQAERMGDKSPACPTCGTTGRFAFGLADRGVFVCRNPRCTLEFAFPQPSDEQLNAFYAQYYYGDGQPVLENSPEPYLRQLVTHLQHEVGPLAGKCALDFGSGIGTLSGLMQAAGARVFGVETDPNARASQLRDYGIEVAPDLTDLAGRGITRKYDLITMIDVIEHVRSPVAVVSELAHLLAPGGWLFISTPDVRSLRARILRQRWYEYQNPTHLYYFNAVSLALVVRAAGLERQRVWRPFVTYPNHLAPRRLLQNGLQQIGLDGALRILATLR